MRKYTNTNKNTNTHMDWDMANRVAFGRRFVSCALPVRKYTNTNKNTNTHMDWDMVNRVAFGRRFVSYALTERKKPLKIRVGCILVKRLSFSRVYEASFSEGRSAACAYRPGF